MSNKSSKKVTWQFRLVDHVLTNGTRRVRFLGARENSRGPWLYAARLPQYVRDWLTLETVGRVPCVGDFASTEEIVRIPQDVNPVTWLPAASGEVCGVVGLTPPSYVPPIDPVAFETLSLFATPEDARVPNVFEPQLPLFAERPIATQWGISDFYGDHKASLRAALEEGRAFTTGFCASKKELVWGRVSRNGDTVRCEALVQNDFDETGYASDVVEIARLGIDDAMERITGALDRAHEAADRDRNGRAVVAQWSVHDTEGRWIETYLEPIGEGRALTYAPGQFHTDWGWQQESDIPARVRKHFEGFLSRRRANQHKCTFKGFTFKLGD